MDLMSPEGKIVVALLQVTEFDGSAFSVHFTVP